MTRPLFVLLLGPSGVGKSTLIRRAQQIDSRVKFVAPITDRPARLGEPEKISVTKEEFDELNARSFFMVVNHIYGYRYGTPRGLIEVALHSGEIPILDYPLNNVSSLSQYRDILYRIYVAPPTFEVLRDRLKIDGRDLDNTRMEDAEKELEQLQWIGFRHPDIDAVLINLSIEDTALSLVEMIQNREINTDVL